MTKTAVRRLDSQEINKLEKYGNRDLGTGDRKKKEVKEIQRVTDRCKNNC